MRREYLKPHGAEISHPEMGLASPEIHRLPSGMNELIETGDPRTKVVGKRRPPAAGSECLKAASDLNLLTAQLRQRPFRVVKGVFRFKSHEDANAWMMNLYHR